MAMQFTNQTVIAFIEDVLKKETDFQNVSSALRENLMYFVNIQTQDAFEVSLRFDALLKAMTTLSSDRNFIVTNLTEISKFIDWTETSETLAMDYLISKEAS